MDDQDAQVAEPTRPTGLSDPSTWVAIYVTAALVGLVAIRRGFRPVIPS